MASVESTICSKAWTDLNIDFAKRQLRHCCKTIFEPFPDELNFDFFNNSIKILERRKALLAGQQHPDCNHCWISYANTGTAYRDFENRWKSSSDRSTAITFIEIMLDNICDMSCIYCNEDFSSKIAAEKKIKQQLRQPTQNDLEVFINWLIFVIPRQTKPVCLSFLGGEITYSKNFFIFVEKLLAAKELHDCNIIFSCLTNGNSNEEKLNKMLDMLDTLPEKWNVNIAMSNEGTGEVSELVRSNLNWERFKYNLEQYVKHPKMKFLCLSPTPCLFTVPSMLEYFTWVFKILKSYNKTVTIAGNWIVYPTAIDVARCSVDKKIYVDQIIELCNNNKSLFAFDNEFNKTIKWLETLKARIGTMPLDENMLNTFLDEKAKEKDDRVYLLRNYL